MQPKAVRIDGWAGRRYVPVEIVGQTQTRYRVKLLTDAKFPRRFVKSGDIELVPKDSVCDMPANQMSARGMRP